MTDPVFTTRAELTEWLFDASRAFNRKLAFGYPHRTLQKQIKRVTLAHSHLPYEATP